MASAEQMSAFGLKVVLEQPKAIVDIVFVHGLRGHRHATWTAGSSRHSCFWPRDLLPKKLTADKTPARILTFGYDADVVGLLKTAGQGRLLDHGNGLLMDLVWNRTSAPTRPIIFVAHSLGGLVVEQALVLSRNSPKVEDKQIVSSTYGITFMGTPHGGADLAVWGRVLTKLANYFRVADREIVGVLRPGSEMLAVLQQTFHPMLEDLEENHRKKIELFCFYEEVPIIALGFVVEMQSAILSRYGKCPIHENHMEMTKFSGAGDNGYQRVSSQLAGWTIKIARRGSTGSTSQNGGQAAGPSTAPAAPTPPSRSVPPGQPQQLILLLANGDRILLPDDYPRPEQCPTPWQWSARHNQHAAIVPNTNQPAQYTSAQHQTVEGRRQSNPGPSNGDSSRSVPRIMDEQARGGPPRILSRPNPSQQHQALDLGMQQMSLQRNEDDAASSEEDSDDEESDVEEAQQNARGAATASSKARVSVPVQRR